MDEGFRERAWSSVEACFGRWHVAFRNVVALSWEWVAEEDLLWRLQRRRVVMSRGEVVVCDAVHVEGHWSLVKHPLIISLHRVYRCRVSRRDDGRDGRLVPVYRVCLRSTKDTRASQCMVMFKTNKGVLDMGN